MEDGVYLNCEMLYCIVDMLMIDFSELCVIVGMMLDFYVMLKFWICMLLIVKLLLINVNILLFE